MPANIETKSTFLQDTAVVRVFRQSLTAMYNIPGLTPKNMTSQLQNTSPFFVVTLVPSSLHCLRLFSRGPDTQMLEGECESRKKKKFLRF